MNCSTDRFEFFRKIATKVTDNENIATENNRADYSSIDFGKVICRDSLSS